MNQYICAILFLIAAVISEYVYVIWKHGKEKNLAKNVLGDILFVTGMVLFEVGYPRTYTSTEYMLHWILSGIYAATILFYYIIFKIKEVRRGDMG